METTRDTRDKTPSRDRRSVSRSPEKDQDTNDPKSELDSDIDTITKKLQNLEPQPSGNARASSKSPAGESLSADQPSTSTSQQQRLSEDADVEALAKDVNGETVEENADADVSSDEPVADEEVAEWYWASRIKLPFSQLARVDKHDFPAHKRMYKLHRKLQKRIDDSQPKESRIQIDDRTLNRLLMQEHRRRYAAKLDDNVFEPNLDGPRLRSACISSPLNKKQQLRQFLEREVQMLREESKNRGSPPAPKTCTSTKYLEVPRTRPCLYEEDVKVETASPSSPGEEEVSLLENSLHEVSQVFLILTESNKYHFAREKRMKGLGYSRHAIRRKIVGQNQFINGVNKAFGDLVTPRQKRLIVQSYMKPLLSQDSLEERMEELEIERRRAARNEQNIITSFFGEDSASDDSDRSKRRSRSPSDRLREFFRRQKMTYKALFHKGKQLVDEDLKKIQRHIRRFRGWYSDCDEDDLALKSLAEEIKEYDERERQLAAAAVSKAWDEILAKEKAEADAKREAQLCELLNSDDFWKRLDDDTKKRLERGRSLRSKSVLMTAQEKVRFLTSVDEKASENAMKFLVKYVEGRRERELSKQLYNERLKKDLMQYAQECKVVEPVEQRERAYDFKIDDTSPMTILKSTISPLRKSHELRKRLMDKFPGSIPGLSGIRRDFPDKDGTSGSQSDSPGGKKGSNKRLTSVYRVRGTPAVTLTSPEEGGDTGRTRVLLESSHSCDDDVFVKSASYKQKSSPTEGSSSKSTTEQSEPKPSTSGTQNKGKSSPRTPSTGSRGFTRSSSKKRGSSRDRSGGSYSPKPKKTKTTKTPKTLKTTKSSKTSLASMASIASINVGEVLGGVIKAFVDAPDNLLVNNQSSSNTNSKLLKDLEKLLPKARKKSSPRKSWLQKKGKERRNLWATLTAFGKSRSSRNDSSTFSESEDRTSRFNTSTPSASRFNTSTPSTSRADESRADESRASEQSSSQRKTSISSITSRIIRAFSPRKRSHSTSHKVPTVVFSDSSGQLSPTAPVADERFTTPPRQFSAESQAESDKSFSPGRQSSSEYYDESEQRIVFYPKTKKCVRDVGLQTYPKDSDDSD